MSESAEYQPQQLDHTAMPPVLEHLRKVAAEMREEVDACRNDKPPKVESVHHLRTGTRRVEATLETLAREAGARGLGQEIETARQRWLKQLKRVRRAAGAVRDLDVHRKLLEENFLARGNDHEANAEAREQALLAGQAKALDHWLESRRSEAAGELCSTLDGHAGRLLEVENDFLAVIAKRRSLARRAHRPAARLAVEDYLRLMDAMPLLDKENLHDFRKGAKKARYVAESEGNDAAAEAVGKTIKRVQDAIGDWHDWVMVAAEAHEALEDGGETLYAELDRRAQEAFDRAMRVTTSADRRLVGEWQAQHSQRRRQPRTTIPKAS